MNAILRLLTGKVRIILDRVREAGSLSLPVDRLFPESLLLKDLAIFSLRRNH